jgi:hypothetical protein
MLWFPQAEGTTYSGTNDIEDQRLKKRGPAGETEP